MANIYDQIKSEQGKHAELQCSNVFQFDTERSIEGCTVITFDGVPGFMWIGPDGVRHNEGLRWPTMRIEQNCTVEVLTDEHGRESKGWYKDGTEI